MKLPIKWKRERAQNKNAAAATPAAPIDPLRRRFARATQALPAALLRTRAYAGGENGVEGMTTWLEAVPGQKGWTVRRITRHAPSGGGEDLLQQQTIADAASLDFFNMIEMLARYELGQDKTGAVIEEEPGNGFAAAEYFRPFAEAEAIAFDDDGLPHPTNPDGIILADGYFTSAAREKARAAAQARNQNAVTSADFFGQSFEISPQLLQGGAQNALAWQEMLAALYNIRDYARRANDKGWNSPSEWAQEKSVSYSSTIYYFLESTCSAFSCSLDELFDKDKKDQKKIRKNLYGAYRMAEFFLFASCGSYNAKNMGKRVNVGVFQGIKYNWDITPSWLEKNIKAMAACLKDIDIKTLPAENSQLLERMVRERPEGYPQELDAIITWFEEMRDLFMNAAPSTLPASAPQALLPAPKFL